MESSQYLLIYLLNKWTREKIPLAAKNYSCHRWFSLQILYKYSLCHRFLNSWGRVLYLSESKLILLDLKPFKDMNSGVFIVKQVYFSTA